MLYVFEGRDGPSAVLTPCSETAAAEPASAMDEPMLVAEPVKDVFAGTLRLTELLAEAARAAVEISEN